MNGSKSYAATQLVIETELRKHELAEKTNLIHKASLEDVKKYDPHYREIEKRSSGQGCFVATVIYGSGDSPEVTLLRGYRDRKLRRTKGGRLFIRAYYLLGPKAAWLLSRLDRTSTLLIRNVLDKLIRVYFRSH